MPSGFIAVHVGAGYHSEEKRQSYEQVCKLACQAGVQQLRRNQGAVDAVSRAVAILEDSPITNAGIGSNLTLTGKVECDASIMDGKTLNYGAVGALTGLRNPVEVAKCLLFEQNKGLLPLGRIPPSLLVGQGAQKWALDNGLTTISDSELSTAKGREAYVRYKRKLEVSLATKSNKQMIFKHSDPTKIQQLDSVLDTVGAVCVDHQGNVASAVSSGGLILKQDGRVGQAAMYGCGCWAQNAESTSSSVAVATTGVGEYLIKTVFARECGQAVASDDHPAESLHRTFVEQFLHSPFLRECKDKLAGALVLKYDAQVCDLMWAHTTSSMCLGYMSTDSKKCKTVLSRLSSKMPDSVELGGVVVRLKV